MSDIATPNLPSRDLERTFQFYFTLGFAESWRGKGWMILKRGDLTPELLPHPPNTSASGCMRILTAIKIANLTAISVSDSLP